MNFAGINRDRAMKSTRSGVIVMVRERQVRHSFRQAMTQDRVRVKNRENLPYIRLSLAQLNV